VDVIPSSSNDANYPAPALLQPAGFCHKLLVRSQNFSRRELLWAVSFGGSLALRPGPPDYVWRVRHQLRLSLLLLPQAILRLPLNPY
jgi:hypothetical protein